MSAATDTDIQAEGIRPVRIERTVKEPGDVVLQSWARPVQIVGER